VKKKGKGGRKKKARGGASSSSSDDVDAERAVKRAEYRVNISAIPDKGKSRFVGVSWNKRNKRWQVQVRDKGKQKHIGYYDDETAAARALDAYVIANKINKNLNFPSALRKHYPDVRPKGWTRFNFPSADGEEGSAGDGDEAGSARGGASSSSSDDVDARAEEEDEGFLLLTRLRRRTGGGGGFLV
jgi:hypothetical protein